MAEITFLYPSNLWFLLSIPLMIVTHFYLLKHSKASAMKFANFETLKRVTGENLLTKNITVLTIRSLILFLIVFGISGSILWYNGQSNNANFVIAIDTSASMTTQDLSPTRLDAAKTYAGQFLDLLDSDAEVGLVSFSGVTFINKVPTRYKFEVKQAINDLDIASAGGTDLAGAIMTSTNMLADSDKGKTIILLTDGSNTIGTFVDDAILSSIAYAMDNHVIIHTIGTGTDTESPIGYIPEYYNISSVYNEENLLLISNSTGGKHYSATNNEALIQAFNDISENSTEALLSVNLVPGFMLIATLLLFIEWGILHTRFKRIP